jgi:hypothetical protein
MEAEDLVVDEGGKGEVVEEVCKVFPYIRVAIFSETFVVETVDLRDLTGFVVATEDCNALGVSDFESNEESDGFNGIVTSINVIALPLFSLYLPGMWDVSYP